MSEEKRLYSVGKDDKLSIQGFQNPYRSILLLLSGVD